MSLLSWNKIVSPALLQCAMLMLYQLVPIPVFIYDAQVFFGATAGQAIYTNSCVFLHLNYSASSPPILGKKKSTWSVILPDSTTFQFGPTGLFLKKPEFVTATNEILSYYITRDYTRGWKTKTKSKSVTRNRYQWDVVSHPGVFL